MARAGGLHSSITVKETPSDGIIGGPSHWDLLIIIPSGVSPWMGGDHITIQGMGHGERMEFEVNEITFSSAEGSTVRGHRVR